MKFKIVAILLALLFPGIAQAHIVGLDPMFGISSDFGPRSGPDFHPAIDYSASFGVTFPALDFGQITRLSYEGYGTDPTAMASGANRPVILILEVAGAAHDFRYLHMFYNSPLPMDSGEFSLSQTFSGKLCIIHWAVGSNRTYADYILSTNGNELASYNGVTVVDYLGIALKTTNAVISAVGPAGGSGGYDPHMHVDLGYGVSENPLAHINHAFSDYQLTILDSQKNVRQNGFLVKSDDIATSFIAVKVNSSIGKDLDSVEMFVDGQDSAHRIRHFSYGGLTPTHDPIHTDIENAGARDLAGPVYSDGIRNGVQPSGVGLEYFIFTDWESENTPLSPKNLSDGQHTLWACGKSIRQETKCSSVDFTIDGIRPYLQEASIVSKTDGTVKYSQRWTENAGTLLRSVLTSEVLGKGGYTVNLKFSEAVTSAQLSVAGAANLMLTSADPEGNQKNFSATFHIGDGFRIDDGMRNLLVRAKDLANNDLLKIGPEKTTIDIASELTRNPETGQFSSNQGADTSVRFVVDKTPPLVTISTTKDDVVSGEQTKEILVSGKKLSLFVNDDPKRFCPGSSDFCDKIAGVESVVAKNLKDEVEITLILDTFNPARKTRTYEFLDLSPGVYTLETKDAVGNITSARMKVLSGVALEVSTTASQANIDRDAGTLTPTLHFRAESASGLSSIGLIEIKPDNLELRDSLVPPSLELSSVDGNLGFTTDIASYYLNPHQFVVGFNDLSGRIVWMPLNLQFGSQQGFRNSYPVGLTSDFSTEVADLVETEDAMLPGAVMSIYAPTQEELLSKPAWWWESRNGFYGFSNYPECGNGVDCAINKKLPLNNSAAQEVGSVKVEIRTGDQPDLSDAGAPIPIVNREMYLADPQHYQGALTCGNQLGYEPQMGAGPFCYKENGNTNGVIQLKRYVQASASLVKQNPTSTVIYGCSRIDESSIVEVNGVKVATTCASYFDYAPSVLAAGPSIYGVKVKMGLVQENFGTIVQAGSNISVSLPEGVHGNFGAHTVFTPGLLFFSYESARNYPGFVNLSGGLAYKLKTEAKFDHARLTIPYDPTGLDPVQEAGLQVFRITRSGEYIALGSTVDPVTRTVLSGEMNEFGTIVVAAPKYTDPRTSASDAVVAGRPELEFTAQSAAVEQSLYTNTAEGMAFLSSAAEVGVPIGNVYKLGHEGLRLDVPGALKMHFDPAAPGFAAIKSLAVYRAEPDGSGLQKLSEAAVDPVGYEIAAEIAEPYGLYLLVGSTVTAALDDTPPVASIAYGEPRYQNAEKLYISSLTPVSLTGVDQMSADGMVSYPVTLSYLVDESPLLGRFNAYTAPFSLADGVRLVYYSAADNVGNNSGISSSTVYVDALAPEAGLFAGGKRYPAGTVAYMTVADSITISAADPSLSGASSGVKGVYRLVDTDLRACVSAAPPPVCNTAEYDGPFTLTPGTHTVYYGAMDNVGNMSDVGSVQLVVAEPVSGPVLPSGAAAYWKFDEGGGATAADSSGNGYNGAIYGATREAGISGGALRFGSGKYVDLGMNPAVETGDFSYSVWLKSNSQAYSMIYTTRYQAPGAGYIGDGRFVRFCMDAGGHVGLCYAACEKGDAWAISDRGGVNDGNWHHVVTVKGVGGISTYIDGVKDTKVYSGDLGSCHRDAKKAIGVESDGQNPPVYFDGLLDEFRVYPKALTTAEVAALYNYTGNVPPAELASITLDAANGTVVQGAALQLTANGSFSDGSNHALTAADGAIWSVDHSSVATVDATGLVTGVAPGTARITVSSGAFSAVANIYVIAPSTNPVGYWKFDEGSGTTAGDSSGNGNVGVWHGSGEHYAGGHDGPGGQFNGVNDYVSIPSSDWLNPGTGEFSVSLWTKPRNYKPEWSIFFSKMPVDKSGAYYYLHLTNDGRIYSLFRNDTGEVVDDFYSGSTVPLDTWTQITYTRDSSTEKIYINGVLDSSRATAAMNATNVAEFLIGARLDNQNIYFDGTIDEVMVYKRALTAEEVSAIYGQVVPAPSLSSIAVDPVSGSVTLNGTLQLTAVGRYSDNTSRALTAADGLAWSVDHSTVATVDANGLVAGVGVGVTRVTVFSGAVSTSVEVRVEAAPAIPAGAVGHWKFDEGGGLTSADSSGGGHNGTLMNGATWTAGKIGNAVSLDGADDYVSLEDSAAYDSLLDGQHAFSVAFWINRQEKDAPQGILSKGNDPLMTAIYLNNSAFNYAPTFMIKTDVDRALDVSPQTVGPALNTWEHWTVTYDGSGLAAGARIYRNGESLPLTVYHDSFGGRMNNNSPVEFGRIGSPLNWHLRGMLDDTRFYSRVLPPEEVAALVLAVPAPVLAALALEPASASILVGGTRDFVAKGIFSDGSSRSLSQADGLTWSVEHSTVATVNYDGAVVGAAAGRTRVVASSGTLNAAADLVVDVPSLPGRTAGYWKFDEEIGDVAMDSSGGANNGVLVNGPVWAAGKVGNGISFDGVDDYVSLANGTAYDSLLDGQHAFSVAFWINRQEKDAPQGILSKGNDPLMTAIYLNNSAFNYAPTFMIKTDVDRALDVSPQTVGPALNTWEHWTVTYDGSGLAAGARIYRNGESLPLTVYHDSFGGRMSNNSPVEFGRIGSPLNWHLRGMLDDIRIYGKVLTAAEVITLASGMQNGELVEMALSPAAVLAAVGETKLFSAAGVFGDGSSRMLSAADGLTWAIDHGSVAVVDAAGAVSGVAPGKTRLRAASGSVEASADIVIASPVPSQDGLASIVAPVEMTVTAISTASVPVSSSVFAAMAGSDLVPVMSSFYEFEPSGIVLPVPAKISFAFDPVGVDTTTLSIYYYDGSTWSSADILNQRVVMESATLAYLEGEISHTSMYALLRKDTAPKVVLDMNPDTLNLKSKGEVVTAHLRMAAGSSGCFNRGSVVIDGVNGQPLASPIAAQSSAQGYAVECGSISVKFSRDQVASILPANAQARLTVSGLLSDGRKFSAEDTVRTIKVVRASAVGGFSASDAGMEFRLGEVYVYPDPAKGGKVPTFHIETGAADSVKIRVFTVAGRLVHEITLGGSPQLIGSTYAYEYVWNDRIASGVYYFTVEAERAGKKLRAKGKFSVVR